MASIFHSITNRTQGIHKSNDWYRRQVSTIASKISASKLMAEGKLLNSPSSGRLNMFFYNPKTKDVLPYYDTFPLVLPLETYNDGFLGLNLHYLPIPLRVKLLDRLVDYTNSEDFTATTTRMVVNYNKLKSIKPFPFKKPKPCIFEYIYFARPDSILNGQCAYEYRKNFGYELAKESYTNVDIIVPVPDSGVPAAIGYSQKIGKNFELGLIRNHYVGRTFIEPVQNIRSFGVKLKLSVNKSSLMGKSIVLIDDSLVRGTTCPK